MVSAAPAALRIEPLAATHDRASFSCGVESLDAYLKTQAGQDIRRKANAVFVLVEPGEPRRILAIPLYARRVESRRCPRRSPQTCAALSARQRKIQQAVATGRAFWRSLRGKPLHAGCRRQVYFSWEALPDGDQRLRCEIAESVDLLLGLKPPIYIDVAVNECGQLELPCSVSLLRRYWNRPAIAPICGLASR